ncbi:MAG: UDP-galactose phosphate transferase [Deltaproteobacteria bacterium HGW-Deltaproteobacteria-4]|nr:MAG: UDP-galactose phosphate transferase [Deltaproteobacteria bacterium HGW-Deltaproteobacteria-4]
MKKRSPAIKLCENRFKRIIDLVLGASLLAVLLPVLLLVAALVRFKMGAPVFFQQTRPGLQGRPFNLYKFRTMTNDRDSSGNLLPDGQRLTKLGRFLRSTSLDELPQLFNVLKGEMSIVGPRPLYMKYLSYYTEHEQKRHTVRPGITGWAQIHGRNQLPWDERLALDVWYAENHTLRLDLEILAKTFWQVLRKDGVAPNTDEVEPDMDQERRNRQADLHLNCSR